MAYIPMNAEDYDSDQSLQSPDGADNILDIEYDVYESSLHNISNNTQSPFHNSNEAMADEINMNEQTLEEIEEEIVTNEIAEGNFTPPPFTVRAFALTAASTGSRRNVHISTFSIEDNECIDEENLQGMHVSMQRHTEESESDVLYHHSIVSSSQATEHVDYGTNENNNDEQSIMHQ